VLRAAVLRVPDTIVCCAEAAMRTHIGGGYCMQRMRVIYNGFDVDLFKLRKRDDVPLRKLLSLDMHAPIVGIVGRYDPAKDYGNFVAAIAKVSQHLPGCHFVMIGKGLDDDNIELRSLIDDAGVSRICHLVGRCSELHILIPGFDLFCLSSRSEGSPTVVGEAMACGVPCVATDVGDTRFLVGETGCC
jgi:glycosyltransferase involved in cell wall biosynthesis